MCAGINWKITILLQPNNYAVEIPKQAEQFTVLKVSLKVVKSEQKFACHQIRKDNLIVEIKKNKKK